MDAITAAEREPARQAWWATTKGMFGLLLAVAIVLRSADWFNPLPGNDESYYLLFAQRLIDGAIPYVDIWDRKPFGLFILVAGLLSFGGNPFVVGALGATLAATATSFLITRIARRSTAPLPALAAGVFYLALLELLFGDGMQTAVFYNFFVVAAAGLLLRTGAALDRRGDRLRVAGAMTLLGVALTIKTIAVFEALALGAWLIVRLTRRRGFAVGARYAIACAAIGVAPTAVIGAGFALIGHFEAWWFACFVSQLRKTGGFGPESLDRFTLLLPTFILAASAGALGLVRMRGRDRTLLACWFAATAVETFAIGNFWPHYALPLAAPAAILAAHVFAMPRRGKLLFVLLVAWPGLKATVFDALVVAENRRTVARVAALIPSDVRRTCLLGYNAPEAFYLHSNACLVSPYLFIDQFRSIAEAKALPVDAGIGLATALAHRPGTILTVDNVYWLQPNPANDALVARTLARHYRRTATVPWEGSMHHEAFAVWRRNDLPPR